MNDEGTGISKTTTNDASATFKFCRDENYSYLQTQLITAVELLFQETRTAPAFDYPRFHDGDAIRDRLRLEHAMCGEEHNSGGS